MTLILVTMTVVLLFGGADFLAHRTSDPSGPGIVGLMWLMGRL